MWILQKNSLVLLTFTPLSMESSSPFYNWGLQEMAQSGSMTELKELIFGMTNVE